MISARHTAWADWIFQPYLTRLFNRHFDALRLLGETPKIEARLPLLLLPNHSTWWDGFFIYLLNKKIFRRRAFVMMLEAQLRLYPFFKYVGVFSVEPSSPAGVRASIRYAAQLLQQKKPPLPLLCIFPQGELQAWRQRPLAYKRGFELILRACGEGVNLLPLAIRAEFLGRQQPEAFFLFGENRIVDAKSRIDISLAARIEETLLDDLAHRIDRGERGTALMQRRHKN